MIGLPADTGIWLAAGITDMRPDANGRAARVESALTGESLQRPRVRIPRPALDMIKVLCCTGNGRRMLAKRLEKGRFDMAKENPPGRYLSLYRYSELNFGCPWNSDTIASQC